MCIGFIGLGVMGHPMAINLVRSGTPLVVWNRSLDKTTVLSGLGVTVAASSADVFRLARTVILMLAHDGAIDAVLGRGTTNFGVNVEGHTIVHMGTTSPSYSQALEHDIVKAGGEYVESPVSGSRIPAERGTLLALMAGPEAAVGKIEPLLRPMCGEVLVCGAVPNGTLTKLATNIVLLASITGLAEAMHAAKKQGISCDLVMRAIMAGPLSSDVMRVKAPKLVADDFSPQASILSALANAELTWAAAHAVGAATPLLDQCISLYKETRTLGCGNLDLTAVIRAMEARNH